jgi:restriction system protein
MVSPRAARSSLCAIAADVHPSWPETRSGKTAAEAERRRRLAESRAAYDQAASAAVRAAQDHNAGVDAFERDFLERDPEAVAEFCTLVLDSSVYPEGFARRTRALYRPDPREVAVEYELPPQSVIPEERDYKYIATRDEIDTLTRPEKEIKDRYARLIAQVAIRTIHEVLISVPPEVASVVTFYGHVSTTDMATEQPIRFRAAQHDTEPGCGSLGMPPI